VFDHRLDAVLAHSIGCLPWVIAAGLDEIPMLSGLAGISFAMSAQLAMLDASTLSWLGHFSPKPLRSTLKGWLVAGLPGLVWFAPDLSRLLPGMAIALPVTPLLVLLLQQLRPRYRENVTRLWLIEGCLALAASLPALLIRP
jgi:hypothetical protein